MRTPAGKDCPQYYADFHRGRHEQECRLAKRNPASAAWQPKDCTGCPVPDILAANASKDMRLTLKIQGGIFGIGRKVSVTAYCEKHNIVIVDPFVGCEQCNAEKPGLEQFLDSLESSTDD